MPVPSFLSSFADKIQGSPLANWSGSSSDPSSSLSHNLAATINHQFRTLQQQYGHVSPSQKMITVRKGVALDYGSLSRDLKSSSKDIYTWGQAEAEDIKDVSDRLAYLDYSHGSLSYELSMKLDSARGPLKVYRNAESSLASRRNIRAGYDREISKLQADRPRGHEKRIAELEQLLKNAEIDDDPLEKEVERLSRSAIRESEQLKWAALREYAEKLIILSHAATQVIDVLPSAPPLLDDRYYGAEATAAVRAAVQYALDNYKLGDVDLPLTNETVDLSRADTRSFGETHARELSSIGSSTSNLPYFDEKRSPEPIYSSSVDSPSVINLEYLNQAPVQLPIRTDNTSAVASPDLKELGTISVATPTVAETGIPQSAGSEGPGPSSGSLYDPRSPSVSSNQSGYGVGMGVNNTSLMESAEEEKRRLAREGSSKSAAHHFESAEEEKRRLAREGSSKSAAHHFESAEEEKKRLEREERERLLSADSSAPHADHDEEESPPTEELPPYNEF